MGVVFSLLLSASVQLFGVNVAGDEVVFNVIADKPYMMRSGEEITNFSNLCTKDGRSQLTYYQGSDARRTLCYPIEGDNPVVELSPKEPSDLCDEWDLSGLTSERTLAPIRAAKGKFKGWYLDWSDVEQEVMDNGKIKHVRDLVLVKDPKVPRKFRKFPIAP